MSTLQVMWTNQITRHIDKGANEQKRKAHALEHVYLILHKYLDSAIAQQGKVD